jgi:hypothetical protein
MIIHMWYTTETPNPLQIVTYKIPPESGLVPLFQVDSGSRAYQNLTVLRSRLVCVKHLIGLGQQPHGNYLCIHRFEGWLEELEAEA